MTSSVGAMDTEKYLKEGASPEKAIGPFTNEANGEVQYRTLTWWQAALLMIAETVSLGILSLPSVLASVGLIPGTILLVGLGVCATYTGYVYGQFKIQHPHVANMADAGAVLMGPFGWWLFGIAQIIFLTFILGSHILTFTIALNTIIGHATCTIVCGIVGLVFFFFLLSIPRTMKNELLILMLLAFVSIVGAVFITVIAVGLQKSSSVVQLTTSIAFQPAFSAGMNICFAYSGHMAFFAFISEMREPKDFPKALITLQSFEISLYVICAVVIYYFAGPNVPSPALSASSLLVKKVAYGVALPTIVIAGVVYANVAAKQIYVHIFRKNPARMNEKSFTAVGTWVGLIAAIWIVAWIIAESIPVFNDLNTLIVALFASWFTYGVGGVFWLFMNYGMWFSTWRKICLTIVNICLFCMGAAVCGIGLYASGTAIHNNAGSGASWSCADNSR